MKSWAFTAMVCTAAIVCGGCRGERAQEAPGDRAGGGQVGGGQVGSSQPGDSAPGAGRPTGPASPDPDSTSPAGARVDSLRHPWTHAVLEVPPTAMPSTLRDVRVARQEGFERVVLDFGNGSLPGYRVSYIDRPVRQCGSGNVEPMPGDGWLEIKMVSAQAHDEQGRPTAAPRIRRPNLPNMKQLTLTCDFEADLVFVAAVLSPNDYRVLELTDPARLVVDIRAR